MVSPKCVIFIWKVAVKNVNLIRWFKYSNIDRYGAMIHRRQQTVFKVQSLIADFCKTWTHPYLSTLDEDNKLIINLKFEETEDDIYQTCIEEATWLTQQSHLYHTKNH